MSVGRCECRCGVGACETSGSSLSSAAVPGGRCPQTGPEGNRQVHSRSSTLLPTIKIVPVTGLVHLRLPWGPQRGRLLGKVCIRHVWCMCAERGRSCS